MLIKKNMVISSRKKATSSCLKLMLTPNTKHISKHIKDNGYNPKLSLSVPHSKSIKQIINHLRTKWSYSHTKTPILQGIRLIPIDNSHQGWTTENSTVKVRDLIKDTTQKTLELCYTATIIQAKQSNKSIIQNNKKTSKVDNSMNNKRTDTTTTPLEKNIINNNNVNNNVNNVNNTKTLIKENKKTTITKIPKHSTFVSRPIFGNSQELNYYTSGILEPSEVSLIASDSNPKPLRSKRIQAMTPALTPSVSIDSKKKQNHITTNHIMTRFLLADSPKKIKATSSGEKAKKRKKMTNNTNTNTNNANHKKRKTDKDKKNAASSNKKIKKTTKTTNNVNSIELHNNVDVTAFSNALQSQLEHLWEMSLECFPSPSTDESLSPKQIILKEEDDI